MLKKVAVSLFGYFFIRKIKKKIMFVGLCLMQNKEAEIHLTLNELKKGLTMGPAWPTSPTMLFIFTTFTSW